MHTISRWIMRCFAATCFAIALPASAYLHFTYTSQPLPLSSYLIDGSPYDLDDTLPPPAFTFSFTAPEQNLSLQPLTHFVGENLRFALISPDADYIDYPLDIQSSSYGQVSLNAKGEIAGWDLMLQMKELITPDTDLLLHGMHDSNVRVRATSEAGDQLGFRFHPVTWHRHWIQLAQLEIDFASAHSGHWTVEQVAVPEPPLVGLFMIGLVLLVWSRQQVNRTCDVLSCATTSRQLSETDAPKYV